MFLPDSARSAQRPRGLFSRTLFADWPHDGFVVDEALEQDRAGKGEIELMDALDNCRANDFFIEGNMKAKRKQARARTETGLNDIPPDKRSRTPEAAWPRVGREGEAALRIAPSRP